MCAFSAPDLSSDCAFRDPPGRLTIRAAVEFAARNYPAIRASLAEVGAAESGIDFSPSGSVRIDDKNYLSPVNSTVEQAADLNDVPIRNGAGPTVYLRDVGYAEDAADILTSYALVDGARAVYIAATKRADASTLEVVQRIKDNLPTFRAAIPEDINPGFPFWPSRRV